MPKLNLSKNALTILEHRYLKKNAKGGLIEKPENMFRRVAKNISLADAKYSHSKQIKKLVLRAFLELDRLQEIEVTIRK